MKRKLFIFALFFGAIFYLILMNPLYATIIQPSTDFAETGKTNNDNNQVAKMRLRADSQDTFWMLQIMTRGQGGDISNAKLGIDPIAQAYSHPPILPGVSVVIKIEGGESGYTEDLRIPGAVQEVWALTVLVVGPTLGGIADANQPGFYPELFWDTDEIGSANLMELRLGDANGPVLADMITTTTYQTQEAEADFYSPEISYAVFSYTVVFESTGTYTYYLDADEDGYGDPNIVIITETQPQGYVFLGDDCDDTDPDVYPLAEEIYDGIDNDCDGEIDEGLGTIYYADFDGDTYGDPNNTVTAVTKPEGYTFEGNDCDDTDPNINPLAEEIDDGIDNDCDGEIDEEPTTTYYADEDADSYGDPNIFITAVSQPAGYVLNGDDCDDTDSAIRPGKGEECNGLDDDCDGMVDEKNSVGCTVYFEDYDQDGYGVVSDSRCICMPEGYYTATLAGDPDDFNPYVPSALEKSSIFKMPIKAVGQGGNVSSINIGMDLIVVAYSYPPAPPPDFTVVLKDKVGENEYSEDIRAVGSEREVWELSVMVGGPTMGGSADASQPGFFPELSWDSNVIRPGQTMDLRLGDANGPVLADMKTTTTYQTKETDASQYIPSIDFAIFSYFVVFGSAPRYYRDTDGDGYGDPDDFIDAEEQPIGYVIDPSDCNDNDPNINPSAEELIDGVDNNCNGQIDEGSTTYYADADGDGYGDPNNTTLAFSQPSGYALIGNDCDDSNPDINPSATEIQDGVDNNCNGRIDEFTGGIYLRVAVDHDVNIESDYEYFSMEYRATAYFEIKFDIKAVKGTSTEDVEIILQADENEGEYEVEDDDTFIYYLGDDAYSSSMTSYDTIGPDNDGDIEMPGFTALFLMAAFEDPSSDWVDYTWAGSEIEKITVSLVARSSSTTDLLKIKEYKFEDIPGGSGHDDSQDFGDYDSLSDADWDIRGGAPVISNSDDTLYLRSTYLAQYETYYPPYSPYPYGGYPYYGTCGYSCPYAENICPVLWCQPLPQPCCFTDGNLVETFDEETYRFNELTMNSNMDVDTNQGVFKMTILPLTKMPSLYGDAWVYMDPNEYYYYGQSPAPYDPNDASFMDANDPDYDSNVASSEGFVPYYPAVTDPNLPGPVYPLGPYQEDMPYGPDTEGPAGVCAISTNCALVGDFDIQFDFCLDDFPLLASNVGSRSLDLDILPLFCGKVCSISRVMNFEDQNGAIHESCYVARLFNDDTDKIVVTDTNDVCGRFKASRRGNSMTLYAWSDPNNDWLILLDGNMSDTDPNGPSEYLEAVIKTQILAIPETDANSIEGHMVSIDNFRVECLDQPEPLTESDYPCPSCSPSSCCSDGGFQDAFEGGLDGNQWLSMAEDGALILDQNQTLRFYMPDTDANTQVTGLYPSEGPRAKTATKCLTCGDFDVRVDYNLISFPSIEEHAATRHVSLTIEGFSPDFNLMNTGEEPRHITYPLASIERIKAADGQDYHYAQTGYYSPHMDMADVNRISGQLRATRTGGNLDLYYRYMDQNDWTLLLSHTEDEFTYNHLTPCVRIALEAGYSITLYPYTDANGISPTDPNQYDPNNYGYGYAYPYSPFYPNDANMPDVQGQLTEFDNFHLECVPLDPNQEYSYYYSCPWYSYTSYDPNTGYPYAAPAYDPNYPYYDSNQYYPYPGYYYGGYDYYGGGYPATGGGYGYGGGIYYGGGSSNWYSPGIGDLYQYYFDADNDGFGDPNSRILAASKPEGYATNAGDSCPDDPYKTEPGVCGCGGADTDADQDGSYECEGDCDETDATIYPGAAEICDGKDNDCDGTVPADETDSDGDGVRICEGDCDDTDSDINPAATEIYDGIDNDCTNGPDDHCYFAIDLSASGQGPPFAEVRFGLDFTAAAIQIDPNNWSDDGIVRLQLIDALAGDIEITNSDTFTESHYLVEDIRVASGQTEIAWYLMVEISEGKSPDLSERYPMLSWDPNNFGCAEINGKDYVYQLIRGLSSSGNVLIENMIDTSSYQTDSQDGETVKYFTILWREKPEPPAPTKKSYAQILPWPGMSPGGLGWPSFSLTGGFPGGLPFPAKVGYPPGISRPSFPGMYPGLTFPGWTYSSWTSTPSYPFVFPRVGLFPSTWASWPPLYWNLSLGTDPYNTGWFYPYR